MARGWGVVPSARRAVILTCPLGHPRWQTFAVAPAAALTAALAPALALTPAAADVRGSDECAGVAPDRGLKHELPRPPYRAHEDPLVAHRAPPRADGPGETAQNLGNLGNVGNLENLVWSWKSGTSGKSGKSGLVWCTNADDRGNLDWAWFF